MTFTKINKRQARKHFNEGKIFWIVPCNLRPECGLRLSALSEKSYDTFDALCNAFEYYNCGQETGRYAAFYIEKE